MGPIGGPVVYLTVLVCISSSYAYLEALAANVDPSLSKFEPMVAFICNKPAMHRAVNGWEVDYSFNCTDDPQKILEYCKKVYPYHDVKNVIETGFKVEIPNWPKFDGPDPDTTGDHKVTPFKCLVEDFESDALLVPQHCVFDHKHDSAVCERPAVWKKTATDACKSRDMDLESTGMLVLCGADAFRGVEYVCCPKDDSLADSKEETDSKESKESQEKDVKEEADDYMAYLHGDDLTKYDNEHEKFKAAQKVMQQHQHEKVTKMMKEWQEARDNLAEMMKTDKKGAESLNKEITERFQRLYQAFEQEADSEKKQLISLHQQRVQAMFNKKKRLLMTQYKEELESKTPSASKVLGYLKQYIRTEEKDRLHTVNRYEHLRDTDPTEASRIRDSLVRHLHLIDERIADAVNMLKRDPELEKKIRPVIEQFRHDKFRSLDLTIDDVVVMTTQAPQEPVKEIVIQYKEDSAKVSNASHDYTNIRIDSEGMTAHEPKVEAVVAHAQVDTAYVQQQNKPAFHSGSNSGSASMVGIVIGSIAVLIIVVVAVVMLKKRNGRQPITHGFVEVDPAASPEERHVANMQMNGYENPTYRYFEVASGN